MIKLQPLFIDNKTGNYVAKDIKEPGICTKQFKQETDSDIWVVPIKTNAFLISVFVDNNLIFPNKITLVKDAETIILEFAEEIQGIANILYLVEDYTECDGVFDERLLKDYGMNLFSVNEEPINK